MTEPTLRTQIVAAIIGLLKPAVKLERPSIEELERILNSETEDAVHINPDGTIDRQEPITTTVGAVADVVLAAVAAAVRGMETKARPGYCAGDKAKLGAGDCPVCGNSSDQGCPYGDYSDYSGIADRLAPPSALPPSAPAVTTKPDPDRPLYYRKDRRTLFNDERMGPKTRRVKAVRFDISGQLNRRDLGEHYGPNAADRRLTAKPEGSK